MSAIYVAREYAEQQERILKTIEDATVAFRSFVRGTEGATKAIDGLEKEQIALQKAADKVSSALNSQKVASEKLAELGRDLSHIGVQLSKMVLTYSDASRMAVRGNLLMATSAEEMDKKVNSLTLLGPKMATSFALGDKEATKFSANILTNLQRVGGSTNMEQASKQVQDYADSVHGSSMMLNMSADDMIDSQNRLMGQARMNIADMTDLMQEAGGYAATLGLEGKDLNAAIASHMDTIMALDKKSRKEYISDLAYTAGVQKRAAVDFGKFSTSLANQTGVESMTSKATLSSLSGVGMGEIAWQVSQATVDPEAAKALQATSEKALATLGVGLDEYQDLLGQRAANTLDDPESARLDTLEALAKPLTEQLGKSLTDILGQRTALRNVEESKTPSKEDAIAASEGMKSKEAQLALQNSLITTDELTDKYSGVVADTAIAALDAVGALEKFTMVLREVGGIAGAADKATGGVSSKYLNWLSGGASMAVGSLLGPLFGKALGGTGRMIGGIGNLAGKGLKGVGNLAGKGLKGVGNLAGKGLRGIGIGSAEVIAESATKDVIAKEVAGEATEMVAKKAVGKAVGKGIGKTVLKKVPIVGALIGAGLGLERVLSDGDWVGGGLELGSGLLSIIPGFGTAASLAVDAYSMKRDIDKDTSVSELGLESAASLADKDTSVSELGLESNSVTDTLTKQKALSTLGVDLDEYQVSELGLESNNVTDVETIKEKNGMEAIGDLLGGINTDGIERGLGNNKKIVETIVPILSDMRDALSNRASSLVSAI